MEWIRDGDRGGEGRGRRECMTEGREGRRGGRGGRRGGSEVR